MLNVRRIGHLLLIAYILFFGAAHFWHLRADFPLHSPWQDWAKYTDEGWYADAAMRARLFGKWYLPGDFNPACAVPVWPLLEWILFGFTGVTLEAARFLAVGCFALDAFLSYLLLRAHSPRWTGLLAVLMLVTNPFLYCFSRLAILEPLLIMLTLSAMNLAIRLPRFHRKDLVAILIGIVFSGMVLTKTSAAFLLPALVSLIVQPFWQNKRMLIRLLIYAGTASAITLGIWMLVIISNGKYGDFRYFFSINDYPKLPGLRGTVASLWMACRGITQPDRVFIALPALLVIAACIARLRSISAHAHSTWADRLWHNPLLLASIFAIAGYLGFMTYQNHAQPRYYVVTTFFSFFLLAIISTNLLIRPVAGNPPFFVRRFGHALLGIILMNTAVNSIWTLKYVFHPEYTWTTAAANLTRYIDEHPNGNRLLLATSGDEITLTTHLPSLCDIWGTEELSVKLNRYKPGWYATWDRVDPSILKAIHPRFTLEQVAAFPAFDDPGHSVLYLFEMHPQDVSNVRDGDVSSPLHGDKIRIPII